MSFNNPVLISGTAGQVNAVYKFSTVATGIDAHIKILGFYNGASLSSIDNFTGAYYDAWQPFINSLGNCTSWVDCFVRASDWRLPLRIDHWAGM